MSGDILEAKRKLPLPALLHQLGFGQQAKKSARCPFHDDGHNSFSIWPRNGVWFWKCHTGCGEGDEITFLEKHRGISRGEAIKVFLEMAAVNGVSSVLSQHLANRTNQQQPFDWQGCVEAFSDAHVEQLAKGRGYSLEFSCWLKEKKLVGLFNDCIAFPVHDRAANVVAAHYRLQDGSWRYYPSGAKVHPLVIGELVSGDPVHVFESQWDGFDFMDKSGERSGVVVTRGSENGKLIAGLIPAGATVYAWKQNDPLKKGRRAGDEWLKDVVAHAGTKVLWARTPEQFKDVNAWTLHGASSDDLLAAMLNADVILEVPAQPQERQQAENKRQSLTIRTINEILEMCFDDKELILTNGYLARGERTAFCGMGGVGKSRLVMQLALCCRTGADFLGWQTQGRELRWLFLQTENSCRRLQYDLLRMLSAFTADEQEAIKAGIFFTRSKLMMTVFLCSISKTPSASQKQLLNSTPILWYSIRCEISAPMI